MYLSILRVRAFQNCLSVCQIYFVEGERRESYMSHRVNAIPIADELAISCERKRLHFRILSITSRERERVTSTFNERVNVIPITDDLELNFPY